MAPRQLGSETAGAHQWISVARRITVRLPLSAMPYLKLGIARMAGYVSDAAKAWQQSTSRHSVHSADTVRPWREASPALRARTRHTDSVRRVLGGAAAGNGRGGP